MLESHEFIAVGLLESALEYWSGKCHSGSFASLYLLLPLPLTISKRFTASEIQQ